MGDVKRIRKIRTALGVRQADLAEAAGVTDTAIRLYETGRNSPSERVLNAIAERLGVAPESLLNHRLADPEVAIHALFELEDAGGVVPDDDAGGASLRVTDPVLASAVSEWAAMRSRLASGEITAEEYDAWRNAFSVGTDAGSM